MNSAYRRFYLYSALSIALLAAAIAVGSVIALLGRFVGLGLSSPTDNDVRLTLSLAVALLLLAIPIGLVHLLMIERALTDASERTADVRHFYLTFWIFVALMAILAGGTSLAALTLGTGVTGDRSIPLATIVVAAVVAVVAWRWRASTAPASPRWDLTAAFATMLVTMIVASVQLGNAADAAERLVTGAHPGRPALLVESTLRTSGAGVVIALIVWAIAARWAWPHRTAVVRIRYLALGYGVGVGSLVPAIAEQLVAADRFVRGAPDPTGYGWAELAVGVLLVAVHGGGLVLDRGRNGHPSVTTDRLLLVLPALAGLGVAYAGVFTLWTLIVDHVLMPSRAHDVLRDHAAQAVALLVAGAAVHVPTWRAALRASDAMSAIRRFATFTVVCLSLVAAVIAGAVTLFNLVSLIAGATDPDGHSYNAVTAVVPALVATAIFAAYFALYLRDQRTQRAAAPPPGEADPLVLLMEDVAAGRVSAVDAAARARTLASR